MSYYAQAVRGQYTLLAEARPVDSWLSDAATDVQIKERLAMAKRIRQFAIRELALPDNGSYQTYTDLKRPYVLWNVVATPALSLKPLEWCFPIAGCVSYRGYYDQDAAQNYATELRKKGNDVRVVGVPAYSTLGWFNDPFLSTYIRSPDSELARLVFHELAHQVVYIKGDSQFNESFATAVEEAGVQRWLAIYGDEKMRLRHAEINRRKENFLALLLKHRAALERNYQSVAGDKEKFTIKQYIFAALQEDYQHLKITWGGYTGYDGWFAEPLSNAHLAAVATYHDLVPGFRALLARHKNYADFYAAVKTLAGLSRSERQKRLAQEVPFLQPAQPDASPQVQNTQPATGAHGPDTKWMSQ